MSFKAIKRVRVHEEIVRQIKELIINGDLKPGQPLPPEMELAKQFGVSLVPTRQALTVLETLGLITRKRGRGIYLISEDVDFISGINDEEFDDLLWKSVITSTKNPVREAMEIRCIVEPPIAKLAAERANKEEIEKMEEHLLRQAEKVEAKECSISEDICFHKSIAAAVKNSILDRIIESIYEPIWEVKEKIPMSEQAAIVSLEGHNAILKTIKNKDGKAAFKAMLIHLKEVEVSLLPLNNK
jgi:GntR family transcriptional repressor for pyruvate dehydrogenase complex